MQTLRNGDYCTLKKYKNGVIHIKLYHATPKENIESINSKGLDNRRRSNMPGWLTYTPLLEFLEENNFRKKGASLLGTIPFFTVESLGEIRENYPEYAIYEVDSFYFQPDSLIVFNHNFLQFVDPYIRGDNSNSEKLAELGAYRFWQAIAILDDYIDKREEMNRKSLEFECLEYIPEVLYFGENISPEYLTLITE